MASRTERWRAAVKPGTPAPNYVHLPPEPPPLITPDCSISNVGVSPPHRARSFSTSSPQRTSNKDQQYPRHHSPPPQKHHSYHYPPTRTPSPYSASNRSPGPPMYITSHQDSRIRSAGEFRSARDSRPRQDVRPGLYVIQPRKGPNVQVLYPQRSDSAPLPRTSHHHQSTHRSYYSPTSEKSLFRRVLDKFGSKDKENLHTRTHSSTAYPPNQHFVQSSKPRRNSTGSSSQWHVVPGEPQYAYTSRTSRKGTVYRII